MKNYIDIDYTIKATEVATALTIESFWVFFNILYILPSVKKVPAPPCGGAAAATSAAGLVYSEIIVDHQVMYGNG